jgi:hypothetical protein
MPPMRCTPSTPYPPHQRYATALRQRSISFPPHRLHRPSRRRLRRARRPSTRQCIQDLTVDCRAHRRRALHHRSLFAMGWGEFCDGHVRLLGPCAAWRARGHRRRLLSVGPLHERQSRGRAKDDVRDQRRPRSRNVLLADRRIRLLHDWWLSCAKLVRLAPTHASRSLAALGTGQPNERSTSVLQWHRLYSSRRLPHVLTASWRA